MHFTMVTLNYYLGKIGKEEVIDIYDLIPPPESLPSDVYVPEDLLLQKAVIPILIQASNVENPPITTEAEANEAKDATEDESANSLDEAKARSREIVEEVLAKNEINLLYSLEFKDLYLLVKCLEKELTIQ